MESDGEDRGEDEGKEKRQGETLDVNGVKEGRIAEGVGVQFIGTILRGSLSFR